MKRSANDQVVHVSSVGHLINHVSAVFTKKGSNYWFRGQRDANWELVPNIFRGQETAKSTGEYERRLNHTFRSRAGMRHAQTPGFEEIARWISLMQHYGLPTRLLDWSRSPLVASYFAVESYLYEEMETEVDACIWMLDPCRLNELQRRGRLVSTITGGDCEDLIAPAFYHDRKAKGDIVQAVMAYETDIRMFVQQGVFTIHSTSTPLDRLKLDSPVLQKLVIPAGEVRKFAGDLSACGFRKGDIFPDLQNLAKDLSVRI